MTHFIDSLVAEYKANQATLTKSHEAPPAVFKQPAKKQKTQVSVAPVVQQMLESMVKGNFELAIHVKAEKKSELPTTYEEDPAIFYLNLPLPLWDTIGQLKQIYSRRITPLITSQRQVEKIAALGELLLQGFLFQEPGTHLVVAPSSTIPTLRHLLALEVFPRGMKTAWTLWNEGKSDDQNTRFALFSERMLYASAKCSSDKAYDDGLVASILSFMDFFSAGVVHDGAKDKQWLTGNVFRKLHTLAKSHLEKIAHYVNEGEDEHLVLGDLEEAVEKVLRYLPDDPIPLLNLFKVNLKATSKAIEDEAVSFSQVLEATLLCYQNLLLTPADSQHYPLIIGHYLLTAALLDIDPRKWPIQKRENYPQHEHYCRLLSFSELQIEAARDKQALSHYNRDWFSSKSSVLITTPEALEQIRLQRSIRSIHFFDLPSLSKTATLGQMLLTNQAQKYPKDPCPLSAIYCSAIDQIKNGYILI